MFKQICLIFLIFTATETNSNSKNSQEIEQFFSELHSKHFGKAEVQYKQITDVQKILQLSKNVYEMQNFLEKIWFFELQLKVNYKWYEALNISESIELYKALTAEQAFEQHIKALEVYKNFRLFLITKTSQRVQHLIMLNNNEFNQFCHAISFLPLNDLQKSCKAALQALYLLLDDFKLLHRLRMWENVSNCKIILFIEFAKQLKARQALKPAMEYKIGLVAKMLMENEMEYQAFLLDLQNIRQSISLPLHSIIFSEVLCLKAKALQGQYLKANDFENFELGFLNNPEYLWSTNLEGKDIIMANKENLKILINFLPSFSAKACPLQLKAFNQNSFILANILSKRILCYENCGKKKNLLWQSWQYSKNSNISESCLWSLENCSGLRRLMAKEQ